MHRNTGSDLLSVFALACLIVAGSAGAFAQSGSAGGAIAGDGDRNLSGPRNDEPEQPASGDVDRFDGSWLFAGIGCHASGFLPAIISHGKLIFAGGSGRVDSDGTVNSIGAGNGITQTSVGRLAGNAGSGTFRQSNGCRGTWTGIKQ
jgi:hypothetical protein